MEEFRPVIVTAAIRVEQTGQVILGVRHFDDFMKTSIKVLTGGSTELPGAATLGFVDQTGKFHNRQEAYKIALAAGQIKKCCGDEGTLQTCQLFHDIYQTLY